MSCLKCFKLASRDCAFEIFLKDHDITVSRDDSTSREHKFKFLVNQFLVRCIYDPDNKLYYYDVIIDDSSDRYIPQSTYLIRRRTLKMNCTYEEMILLFAELQNPGAYCERRVTL